MEFTLTIDLDGAAFAEGEREELSRLLSKVSTMVADPSRSDDLVGGTVRDINGNTIGSWAINGRGA